jgi:hypothetical protein
MNPQPGSGRVWAARVAVGLVLVSNLSAAIPYLLHPDRYAAAFELTGVAGAAMVRGLGILFVMWCAAYLPLIARPDRHRVLFGVVVAQQVIGLAGETWILATLPPGHPSLAAAGVRFIAFDGAGLALLCLACVLSMRRPE